MKNAPRIYAFTEKLNDRMIELVNQRYDAGDKTEAARIEMERRILYRLDRIEKALDLPQDE